MHLLQTTAFGKIIRKKKLVLLYIYTNSKISGTWSLIIYIFFNILSTNRCCLSKNKKKKLKITHKIHLA